MFMLHRKGFLAFIFPLLLIMEFTGVNGYGTESRPFWTEKASWREAGKVFFVGVSSPSDNLSSARLSAFENAKKEIRSRFNGVLPSGVEIHSKMTYEEKLKDGRFLVYRLFWVSDLQIKNSTGIKQDSSNASLNKMRLVKALEEYVDYKLGLTNAGIKLAMKYTTNGVITEKSMPEVLEDNKSFFKKYPKFPNENIFQVLKFPNYIKAKTYSPIIFRWLQDFDNEFSRTKAISQEQIVTGKEALNRFDKSFLKYECTEQDRENSDCDFLIKSCSFTYGKDDKGIFSLEVNYRDGDVKKVYFDAKSKIKGYRDLLGAYCALKDDLLIDYPLYYKQRSFRPSTYMDAGIEINLPTQDKDHLRYIREGCIDQIVKFNKVFQNDLLTKIRNDSRYVLFIERDHDNARAMYESHLERCSQEIISKQCGMMLFIDNEIIKTYYYGESCKIASHALRVYRKVLDFERKQIPVNWQWVEDALGQVRHLELCEELHQIEGELEYMMSYQGPEDGIGCDKSKID